MSNILIYNNHPFPDLIKCLWCDAISEVDPGDNVCPNCLTEGMNVWADDED